MTPTGRRATPIIPAAALAVLVMVLSPLSPLSLVPGGTGTARAQEGGPPATGEEAAPAESSDSETGLAHQGFESDALTHEGLGGKNYVLSPGKTHRGDSYRFEQTADIAGIHDGDLFIFAQNINVSGEVTGDMFAFAQNITLSGRNGDSVRIFGNTIMISGEIDGNLIACGETVTLGQDAHIKGDLLTFGSQAFIRGRVDGEVKATVGELVVGGDIGGDVRATTSLLRFEDGARIDGDLECTTQQDPPDLEGTGIVGGRITFDKKEFEEDDDDDGGGYFWKGFLFLSSLVIGFFFLGLFRQPARTVAESIGFANSAIGFLAWMVIPFAAAISCILIITIPLAMLVLLLWVILTYIAKLPVAFWLGTKALGRMGRPDPSPFLALPLGLLALNILFLIPWIGTLAWFLTLFAGFGAIIVGLKIYLSRKQRGGPDTSTPTAPPPVMPPIPPMVPAAPAT